MKATSALTACVLLAAACICAWALTKDDDTADAIGDLKSQNPETRSNAAVQLGTTLPLRKQDIRLLEPALEDKDESVRLWVAIGVMRLDPAHRRAYEVIAGLTSAASVLTRTQAAIALGKSTFDQAKVLETLVVFMSDECSAVRCESFRSVGRRGKGANRVLPTIIGLLESEREYPVRYCIIRCIGDIGSGSAEAAAALTPSLKRNDERERDVAADALGRVGPMAKGSTGMLVVLLKGDSCVDVRLSCAEALGRIKDGSPTVIQGLRDCLVSEKDQMVKGVVIDAIGELGTSASQAVPELIDSLSDNYLRKAAVQALGRIGKNAKASLPALERLRKDAEADNDVEMTKATTNAIMNIR